MEPGSETPQQRPVFEGMVSLARGICVLTAFFCALIFFIPPETYPLYSNLLEIGVALFCLGCCLWLYRTNPDRAFLLLAAFAFLGFALSNTFWYLYTLAFGRTHVFFSVSEMGFLGFMLFVIVGFRIELKKTPYPLWWRIALAGLFGIIAFLVALSPGLNPVTDLLMLRILIVIWFIDSALGYGVYRYPHLWEGVCLFGLSSILYGLRDTFIITQPYGAAAIVLPATSLNLYTFLSIVGPLDVLSFLLILLGIFAYLNSARDKNTL